MSADTMGGVSRREFLIFLYKYRLRLLLAFLVPFILAVLISTIPTPRYKAAAVLVVRMGSEYVYQPEVSTTTGAQPYAIPLAGDQIFKSEVAILNSADLHEKVIAAIGIDKLFPELVQPSAIGGWMKFGGEERLSKEDAAARLKARALDKFEKRFDIVLEKDSSVINVSFEHKDRQVATLVLEKLISQYFEKRRQLYLQPRSAMAEAEMKERREKVLAANKALENFKREHAIFSLEDQKDELLKRRSEAQRQSQIIFSPELERRVAQLNVELDKLDANERQLTELEKEAELASDSYTHYSGKLDEAKAYDNLQRERADSVRVIQPPVAPAEPKKLQPLIILGGLLVSVVFSLLVAAMTEFFRSGFLTPEQLERNIGLPVLAVIPLLKKR